MTPESALAMTSSGNINYEAASDLWPDENDAEHQGWNDDGHVTVEKRQ